MRETSVYARPESVNVRYPSPPYEALRVGTAAKRSLNFGQLVEPIFQL
jgi:hypothetical protein